MKNYRKATKDDEARNISGARLDEWEDINGNAHGCLRIDGVARGGFDNEDIPLGRRVVSRYNNYPEAMQALRRAEQSLAEFYAEDEPPSPEWLREVIVRLSKGEEA
jgi:hypothetical protein